MNLEEFANPFKLQRLLWPHVRFYKQQIETIESVFYEADETIVTAGNMLGDWPRSGR